MCTGKLRRMAFVGSLADQRDAGRASVLLEEAEPPLQMRDLLDRRPGDEQDQVRGLEDRLRGSVW
jgi:hypothetical protein